MNTQPLDSVDLTNCDKEPIHLLGTIQPCGYLVVSQLPDWRITHVSQNIEELFGKSAEDLLGTSAAELLGRELHHEVTNRLTMTAGPEATERMFDLALGKDNALYDVSLHAFDGKAYFEFEPSPRGAGRQDTPLENAKAMIVQLRRATSRNAFFTRATQLIRAFTGFDRVMIYKFAPDGSGEVIAESAAPGIDSFLGLHYPASDIPRQARELYRKNWIRTIRSVNDVPVPIIAGTGEEGPLDLSYATLRSVSPIHVEYLRNMGVDASLSISILHTGRLWGLIACHHYSPRHLTLQTRTATEVFGLYLSLQLESMERAEEYEVRRRAEQIHAELLPALPASHSLFGTLQDHAPSLCQLLECDGFGFWIAGQWHGDGDLPATREIPALMEFLATKAQGQIWSTAHLGSEFPPAREYADATSGILAIPLSSEPRDYLIFTRSELVRTVNWAGNPEKPVTIGPLGDRLTPRKSFEIWKEEVKGQSEHWTPLEMSIAQSFHTTLLEVAFHQSELVDRHRQEASERQAILIAELNHRVKNLLALTRSIVRQTRESSSSLESFANNLEGRISALAFAHDQLHSTNNAYASLSTLVKAELAPYVEAESARGMISGPPVMLDARAFPSLALVLHELATNSAKYGSLSVREGTISITWTCDEAQGLEIIWEEANGPPVKAPEREGFGGRLIRETVPFELGGETEIQYRPSGLGAKILIPPTHIVLKDHESDDAGQEALQQADLDQLSILLAEDNLIIGLDTEARLRELGVSEVSMVSSVAQAVESIEQSSFDAALLDVNLGSGDSIPIADELYKRDIPFIFATGYAELTNIPSRLQEIPLLRKPFSDRDLVSALRTVLNN